jgi:hypothetical protein
MRISSALGQSLGVPQPSSCESRKHGVAKKRKPSNMRVATAKKSLAHSREKRKMKFITLNTGSTVDGSVLARNGAVVCVADSAALAFCALTPTLALYAIADTNIS